MAIKGLPPLHATPRRPPSVPLDLTLAQVVTEVVKATKSALEQQKYQLVSNGLQLLLFISRRDAQGSTTIAKQGGPALLLDVVQESGTHSAKPVLDFVTALLLDCARCSERCADDLMETSNIRLILQAFQSPDVNGVAKQNIAVLLHHLATAKLLYKDILQGAGVLDILLDTLSHLPSLCDLTMIQECLWVMTCLSDDDPVYKEYMRDAGALQLVTALLAAYQVPTNRNLFRPIAALMVRCLRILSHDDDVSKEQLRTLGLISILVQGLQNDIQPVPSSNGSSAHSHMSPLQHASSSSTPLGALPVLEKLPAWQRFTACIAARAILQPLATTPLQQRQLALLCHALMLPMLDGVGAGKRLSLVTEAAGALKSLLCDSPDNQRAAVEGGGVPVMVQLLYAHNLNIAGSAAEAISYLMNQFRHELVAHGAVEGLVELLKECNNHIPATASLKLANAGHTGTKLFAGAASRHSERSPAAAPSKEGTLIGRQRISSPGAVASSCGFSNHEPCEYCGYCALTAVLKGLLRIMSREAEVQDRFVSTGGLAVLFKLLQPQVGLHHSRLASSLISLLNIVMDGNRRAQDLVRESGGVALLCRALDLLVQPGVSDILQLRVALCLALQRAVQDNAASQLAAKPALVPLLVLMQIPKVVEGPRDVDDLEQLAVAATDALSACLYNNPELQSDLYSMGMLSMLVEEVCEEGVSPALKLSATRALGMLAQHYPRALAELNEEPRVMSSVLVQLQAAQAQHDQVLLVEAIMRLLDRNPRGKPAAVAQGALGAIIALLHPSSTNSQSPQLRTAVCRALGAIAAGDQEMQNHIANQDGVKLLVDVIEECLQSSQAPLCAALHAMSAVVNHNTFTKNIARQLDILPTLAILLRQPGAATGHAAVFLIRCVADVCDSNHANQEALAEAGLVEGLVGLLSSALADGLQGAQGQVALVQQLARAIGNAGEFHRNNKILVREAGGLRALGRLLAAAADVPEGELLRMGLAPAIAQSAGAIAQLAQDCEENQRHLLSQDLAILPVLFRLMKVDEPVVATQVAKAVEYIAVRNDIPDAAEEVSEVEAETIKSLVGLLHRSSSSAMVVREAAAILNKVSTAASAASEPSPSTQPGSPKGLFRRGSSLNSEVRRRAALGASQQQQQSSAGGVQLRSTTSSNGGVDGPQMLPLPSSSGSPPLPVSSSAVDDQELGVSRSVHDAGLLVLPSLERSNSTDMASWQAVAGKSAPAFQQVAGVVGDGPWRQYKMQVAWMLFLLAIKSSQNRELVAWLERTSVAPVAAQLTNAEAYQNKLRLSGNPELSEITSAVVAAAATAARASAIHSSTQLPPPVPAAAAAPAQPAQPAAPGDGAILSDDCMEEMEMLQQQVDLLARHSSVSMHITPPLGGQQQGGIGPSGLGPRAGSLQDLAAATASAGSEVPQGEGADSDDVRETAAMATIIASGVLPAALHLDGGSSSGEDEAANVVMMVAGGEEEEENGEGAERVGGAGQ